MPKGHAPIGRVTIFAGEGEIGPALARRLRRRRCRVHLVPLAYPGQPNRPADAVNPYQAAQILRIAEESRCEAVVFTDRFLAPPRSLVRAAELGMDPLLISHLKTDLRQVGVLLALRKCLRKEGLRAWSPSELDIGFELPEGDMGAVKSTEDQLDLAFDMISVMRRSENVAHASTVYFNAQGPCLVDGCMPVEEAFGQLRRAHRLKDIMVLRSQIVGAPIQMQTPVIDNNFLRACAKAKVAGVFFEATSVIASPNLAPEIIRGGFLRGF